MKSKSVILAKRIVEIIAVIAPNTVNITVPIVASVPSGPCRST